MSGPFEAAWEVGQVLASHQIPYVVIGGLAVQVWGEARFTKDADLSVSISPTKDVTALIQILAPHFKFRVTEPAQFAQTTRMILLMSRQGIEVDIALALPGYEEQLFARAVEYEFETTHTIQLCSSEDLIIHKALAGRPQDIVDIEGIVARQGDKLDVAYIRQWLKEFSEALSQDDIVRNFEAAWRKR